MTTPTEAAQQAAAREMREAVAQGASPESLGYVRAMLHAILDGRRAFGDAETAAAAWLGAELATVIAYRGWRDGIRRTAAEVREAHVAPRRAVDRGHQVARGFVGKMTVAAGDALLH